MTGHSGDESFRQSAAAVLIINTALFITHKAEHNTYVHNATKIYHVTSEAALNEKSGHLNTPFTHFLSLTVCRGDLGI